MSRARRLTCAVAGLLAWAGLAPLAHALTVEELRDALAGGQRVTLIDIRPNVQFANGHIPGAMNIPAKLATRKRLPALGTVIVYGDGYHTPVTQQAAAELGAKPGIEVEILEGGYAAWSSGGRMTSQSKGFRKHAEKFLTLAEVKDIAVAEPNLVLVDLRSSDVGGDLLDEFPNTMILESRGQKRAKSRSGKPGQGKVRLKPFLRQGKADNRLLFVLVDDGDGRAEKAALRMRAAGVSRLAILAGGQLAIEAGVEPSLGTLAR